jgi:hypothetical protein
MQATDVSPLTTSLPKFAGKHWVAFSSIWDINPFEPIESLYEPQSFNIKTLHVLSTERI